MACCGGLPPGSYNVPARCRAAVIAAAQRRRQRACRHLTQPAGTDATRVQRTQQLRGDSVQVRRRGWQVRRRLTEDARYQAGGALARGGVV